MSTFTPKKAGLTQMSLATLLSVGFDLLEPTDKNFLTHLNTELISMLATNYRPFYYFITGKSSAIF
jgi:hypothetical protein